MLAPPNFTSLATSECILNIYLVKEVYMIRCPHLKINIQGNAGQCYMTGLL